MTDVKYWVNEIDDAKKRDKDFCKDGKDINELYNGEKPDEHPFNILYSNTDTLKPALYSQLPRPLVKERFTEKDNQGFTQLNPLTKAVSEASKRMLSYLLDTNVEGYEKFHDAMKAVVLDALLPGRGVTSIQFDAVVDDDSVKWASIVANTRKYNRVLFGFATKWEKVPWVAYEEYIDEEEAKEKFGAKAKDLSFTITEEDEKNSAENEDLRKTALIYQIWHKDKKQVLWIAPKQKDFLRIDDDPLEITGFFNTPKPLMLHRKSNDLTPTPLYQLYENQAKELNRLTRSINKVAHAMKVRGAYDGNLGELLARILDEEDNVLVPVENLTALMDGGFEKHIWFLPLAELAGVLTQLYTAREQCKQVIYEITGISDILRGTSKASETLGAQEKKEAWGIMRIKDMQGDVQDYVKDLLRIMLDVAAKKVPQSLWIKVTGLPYPTREKKEEAVDLMNQLKKLIQQDITEQNEEELKKHQKQAGELAEMLTMPSWEDILEALNDDYIRSFKVDIETNSTLDAEATEDKKNLAEGMNAIAQFMNGLMPMVEKNILPFGAAKSMLLDVAKRFRFGEEVEEEINAMQAPKQFDSEQAQKKLAEEKKKLEQEKQQFEQEKTKAGDDLDNKANKLEIDKISFQAEKKVFMETMKVTKKYEDAMLDLKAKSEVGEVKNMLEDHKRGVQSMMDKQIERMKDTIESVE